MLVEDIMAKDVVTVSPDELVANTANRMKRENVGCLVVTTKSKAVKGVITDRDLTVGCLGEAHDANSCKVSNHMSSPAITIGPGGDVLDAAHTMAERKIKRLPVVSGGKLVGLLSYADVAMAMQRPLYDLLEAEGMDAAKRIF
jgi:signal-transduction protein with cAMP-binding, CBS, and nucleotidyltransferase domain